MAAASVGGSDPAVVIHGTASAYTGQRSRWSSRPPCHCVACRKAWREYIARYRERKRAQRTEPRGDTQ